ncbi:hypothetical protein UWK_01522 [Desulfocapsa sulfexigens DSM 10523]|uniref:Uncharacterized protein n=1 Tax=Desulfocapsa sulfexigens (strain DSM 10523 / SB164P1) TaxID=1167006 RepID=M1PEE1_DESSD|nr:hypothetical protein [Desulfocapsa sulfexigens]AGF78080.1 hypothetical protein UWK_01522 [Desulfocapsa sulfexigens DSM 10523]
MNKQVMVLSCLLFFGTGCAGHHFTTEGRESVSLYLHHPGSSHVQFASSIDRYTLHDTHRNLFGLWEISKPLTPGSSYFYIIDGSVFIPDCRFRETDDFGFENCLYQP